MNKTDHQKHDNEEEMTPKEVPNQTANQIASSQQPTNHIEASNNGHDIDVMVTNVIKDGGQGNGHNILKNTSPEKTTISSSTSDENIFSRIEVETRSDLIQQTVKQIVQERMEKLENNLFEGFKKELKRINEENVNLKRRERTLKGRIQLLESNLKVSTDKSTNTEECSLIQKMKIGDEKAPTNEQKESENEGDEISISPRTRIDLAEDKILPLTCSPNSSSSVRDENDITPLAPSDDNSTVIEVVETSLSREETKIELENSDELVIDEKIDIPVKDSSTEESCVEKTLSISDKPMTIERFDKGTTTKENKGTFIEVGDLKHRDEELVNQNGAFFRSADQKDDRLTPRDHDIALAKPTNQGIASNESTNEIEDMLSPRISTSTSSITASVETANNNFVPAMFRSLPTMEVKPYQLTTEPERKVDQIVEKYKERNLTADRNPPVFRAIQSQSFLCRSIQSKSCFY
ncbi:uncharacterized protein [Clytia hemisphaerica]|uniref:uncharacterized protein n=1 Tax=Clytia hemisphaerica TaxID=252671 RepID=UPI0034D47452